MKKHFSMLKKCWVLLTFYLVALLISPHSLAIGQLTGTPPEELKLLPAYCWTKERKDGNNRSQPDVAKWSEKMGWENYNHLHHYCLAILHYHKSKRGNEGMSEHLTTAKNNIYYIIQRVSDDFYLLSEMMLYRGLILEDLGEISAAIKNYQEMISLYPGYERPYLELSRILIFAGEHDKAKEVIDLGLKKFPESKGLSRRQLLIANKLAK